MVTLNKKNTQEIIAFGSKNDSGNKNNIGKNVGNACPPLQNYG